MHKSKFILIYILVFLASNIFVSAKVNDTNDINNYQTNNIDITQTQDYQNVMIRIRNNSNKQPPKEIKNISAEPIKPLVIPNNNITIYTPKIDLPENNYKIYINNAKDLYKAKQYLVAIENFEKAYTIHNDPNIIIMIAQCYINLENYQEAQQYLFNIKSNPSMKLTLDYNTIKTVDELLAYTYKKTKEYYKAEMLYTQLVNDNFNRNSNIRNLVSIYDHLNQCKAISKIFYQYQINYKTIEYIPTNCRILPEFSPVIEQKINNNEKNIDNSSLIIYLVLLLVFIIHIYTGSKIRHANSNDYVQETPYYEQQKIEHEQLKQKQKEQQIQQQLKKEQQNLEKRKLRMAQKYWFSLSGQEFESEMENLFSELGYKVVRTPCSGDGGVDLILEKDGEKTIVQCKAYKHKVGPEPVRALWGVMDDNNADKALFIALSGFTKGSIDFINDKKRPNYFHWDINDIIKHSNKTFYKVDNQFKYD